MPLKPGSSRKTVSGNIQELVDTYQSKGRIGTSTPKSKKAAVKQAVAISLKKAVKNMEQYRQMMGRLEGYTFVEQVVQDMLRKETFD